MKSEKQINKDILNITSVIEEEYPELYHFLNEMPEEVIEVSKPRTELKELGNYYKSLEAILIKYATSHNSKLDLNIFN